VIGVTTQAASPSPVRTVLGSQRQPGDLPFTGDGTLPGNDWAWLFSIAGLGAGIIIAVAVRRAITRDD
jgi:hypothetical protein